MAIQITANQQLGFTPLRDCNCPSNYCQPLLTTDEIILQGATTAATGLNLIADGEFSASTNWDLDTGFTISAGKLHGVNVTPPNAATSIAPIGLVIGKIYIVQAAISVISAGSAGVNQGYRLQINGEFLGLPSTTSGSGYNASLVGTWLYQPSAINTDIIVIDTNENTIDFDVDYFRVYEWSMAGIGIYNSDGELEDSTDTLSSPNSIDYYFYSGANYINTSILNKVLLSTIFTSYTDVNLLINIIIEDITDITSYIGCMQFAVYDSAFTHEIIRNGDFATDLSYWLVGTGWTWVTGRARLENPQSGTFRQTVVLQGGNTYELNYDVESSMRLLVDLNQGAGPQVIQDSNGIIGAAPTATIDVSALSGPVTVDIYFTRTPATAANTFLDNVSLLQVGIGQNLISHCIDLQTSHGCTMLLVGENNDNAFGFIFQGGFKLTQRVYGKIRPLSYPEENETFVFSDASRQLMYARSEKEYTVIIGDAAEHVHDNIRLIRLTDTFTIDGSDYVASGDYSLKVRKTSDRMQADFSIRDKQGLSANYSCS